MAKATNSIYIENPESADVLVSQDIYTGFPNNLGKSDEPTYGLNALSVDVLVDDTHMKKTKNTAKAAKIVALSATVMAGSGLGAFALINPLVTRPKLSKESYSLVDRNHLKYSVTLSTTSRYQNFLVLSLDDKENQKEEFTESKTYEGEFVLTAPGEYKLSFVSTNNFDYRVENLKYTVTIKEADL